MISVKLFLISPMNLTISLGPLMKMANEFRQKFNVVNCWSKRQRDMQRDLIVEEFREFLVEASKMQPVNVAGRRECLKELADLVYVCYQYAANLGWNLDEALARVHESNLSKLDYDGKPITRADGKVLKGPNYAPPNLDDLV